MSAKVVRARWGARTERDEFDKLDLTFRVVFFRSVKLFFYVSRQFSECRERYLIIVIVRLLRLHGVLGRRGTCEGVSSLFSHSVLLHRFFL